ncbi:MAG TPA: integrase arm-type DNA-binding domain-containing protein [Steroidobacteraceae bacterium]|nr:integrase arm-type DNA-binding domain-containing protein [Steroidobacteraceae bacterium]
MLTDTGIKAAIKAAGEKPLTSKPSSKLSDGKGLHLWVYPGGRCYWRFRYRIGGVEKMLSFGTYPDVPLKLARGRHEEARKLVAAGIDPSAKRREKKAERANTFDAIATEWMTRRRGSVNRKTKRVLAESTWERDNGLVKMASEELGKKPIAQIEVQDVLAVIQDIEEKGLIDTAHRVRGVISRVFKYAILTKRAKHDVVADIDKDELAARGEVHYPSITDPTQVGALLRAIDGFDGMAPTCAALRLAPLVFTRPGELRAAEWSEMDVDSKEPTWRIPAPKMKMRDEHVVPLSTQAVAILKKIQQVSGDKRYVFPAIGVGDRPLSENTLNSALRRLGYDTKKQMCAHGFRSMASTLLNEQGWHPDLIELQLAHKERNSVRGAYNKSVRLADRRRMMQAWADYLDGLRAGSGNVVGIGAKKSA